MATIDEKFKVKNMIGNRTTAMLVTHDEQGGLVSRPMTTQQPQADGEIWFFVSADADVLGEINANPEVNLSYMSDGEFVSINGRAVVVDNDDKKVQLWYDELAKWFDGHGPTSSMVKLIKFTSETARFWDTSQEREPDVELVRY